MLRLLTLAIAVVLLFAGAAGAARAEDAVPSKEEQVRHIRKLPIEEKHRLKAALDRFNALPAAERDRLRRKAREVGAERLGELAGRDFERLRHRHEILRREIDEVMKLLGAPERLAALEPDERAFVRYEALRAFQAHCRIAMLEQAGLAGDFGAAPAAERRGRLRKAADAAVAKILDEKPPAEQSRYRTLSAVEQRRERADLLAEWRMRETVMFAKKFERFRLNPFLAMPPDKRREAVARKVRWFQLAALVQSEGADRDTLKMLGHLTAEERAQVALLYEQSRDLPPADRRARVVDRIRELYGTGAVDADRPQRPMPRLRELFRERRIGDPAPPPTPPASTK